MNGCVCCFPDVCNNEVFSFCHFGKVLLIISERLSKQEVSSLDSNEKAELIGFAKK